MDSPAARGVPEWSTLLLDAVNKPGIISDAYRRFWNYSVGNLTFPTKSGRVRAAA